MTPAEKALGLLNSAAKRIIFRGGTASRIPQPATHLISGCHWKEAITEINAAINDLNQARAALAPLAENRPRD